MDLVTPAKIWAAEESAAAEGVVDDVPHDHRMPLFQRVVMFCSVVGPIVGLVVAIVLLWDRPAFIAGIGWAELGALAAMYALAGFGVTIGFHRLLTHRSFETYRPIRLLLAILGSSAGQGMCIRWCATHRRHHQRSDRDGDPHSPHIHADAGVLGLLKGMFHAHVGWCFQKDRPDLGRSVSDLLDDRVMLWIDQLYFFCVALGIVIAGIAVGLLTQTWHGFFAGMIWGGFVRICLMQHVTWSINSVCHVWGTRPFHSADHSTNNFPIALVSLGEGWHNNHHAFPTSARHGLKWWEFDSSYLVIRAMSYLGLAWNINVPPESAVQAKLRCR